MVRITLEGRYRDTIKDIKNRRLEQTPFRPNIVVYRALDLIAGLLRCQRSLGGILFWAVGSGDPSWDGNQPAGDRRTTQLVNEIYRKSVDSTQDITYNPETHTVTIRTTIGAHEAVGESLREFGLFGGDASSRPNSGYLINHVIHAAINKTEQVLERDVQLILGSGVMLDRGVDLIARLLSNQPGLGGIQYWAVGPGDPNWDETPPTKDVGITQLEDEIYRKPLEPAHHITYHEDTRTLVVRADFAFDEAAYVLREFGLFGGDATSEKDSGYLLNHQIHPGIDKNHPLALEREFRLTLGSEPEVQVPDLTEKTVDQALTDLEEANLTLGMIHEIESEEGIGQVIGMEPPPNEWVSEGTTVDITVAVPIRVVVPDVCKLTPGAAATVLDDAGLVLSGEEPSEEESRATPGTIIHQTPPAGARVNPGTEVYVVLAKPVTTIVPDLTDKTAGQAAIFLRRANLILAPPPYPVEQTNPPWGKVVAQDPSPDTQVDVDTPVGITLSVPWTVDVPDLYGKTPDEAADALREEAAGLLETLGRPADPPGLALGAQTMVESEETEGTIVGQYPGVGDSAPLYGTVNIEVATPVKVTVPDLFGKDEGEAEEELQGVNLTLGIVESRQNVAPIGTVIEQEPPAGFSISVGSAVKVILAEPILVEVPYLIGRMFIYAREAVPSRQLVLREPPFKEVSDQPEGTIVRQDPEGGVPVAMGSTVFIWEATQEPLQVPDVIGLTPEQARPILTSVGLDLAEPPYPELVSDQPVGTIARQQPEAGSPLVGGIMLIWLATRVPDVVGQTPEVAGPILEAVGLVLTQPPYPELVSDLEVGAIVRQEPESGAVASEGDEVSIWLATRVPDVVGQTPEGAGPILEAVGLVLAQPPYPEEESDQPAGTIVSQNPSAGSIAAVGDVVNVVIAISRTVEVPLVVGKLVGVAEQILSSVELVLLVGEQRESDEPSGIVLEQEPVAGVLVPVGSTVTVVVAVPRPIGVTGVDPNWGYQGEENKNVTISGSNFKSGATVIFSGNGITVHSVTFIDSSSLEVNLTISSGATVGLRDVTVTNPDGNLGTGQGLFEVKERPTVPVEVDHLVPNYGRQGETIAFVTVFGSGFQDGENPPFVFFIYGGDPDDPYGGGIVYDWPIQFVSTGELKLLNVAIGQDAPLGPKDVIVKNQDGTECTLEYGFTVLQPMVLTSGIFNTLNDNPLLNITRLSETLETDRATLRPELDRMVEAGVITRDSRGRYSVVPILGQIVNVISENPDGIPVSRLSTELNIDADTLKTGLNPLREVGVIRFFRGRYYLTER